MEQRVSFTADNLNGSFVLTVYNGGLQDHAALGEYVSSSTIKLNGVAVVGPENFNQNTDVVSVPVSLSSVNELSMELRGKPGGAVTVEITGEVNTAPVADAGVDRTVTVGASVALDGSASFDPDGDDLTFAWSLVARLGRVTRR